MAGATSRTGTVYPYGTSVLRRVRVAGSYVFCVVFIIVCPFVFGIMLSVLRLTKHTTLSKQLKFQ